MIKLTEKQIEEIADYLESGLRCFYNKRTRNLITIDKFDNEFEIDMVNHNDLLEFNSMSSKDSYETMINFVEQLNDYLLKEKLINILNKSKPFNNFKLQIDNSGDYRQKWFDFKNNKYVDFVKLQIEIINDIANSELNIEDEFDYEEWEDEVYFYDREDWSGLLDLQKRRAEKDPTDLQRQEKYAIALNLNQKFDETLKLLEPLYRKNYKFGYGINEIMKALLGLNRTEKDFKWIKKPDILKLDEETINLCINLLKGKRKPISISDIFTKFIVKADFLYFNEQAFAEYLSKFTNLFNLFGDSSDFWNMKIKLKKKKIR